MQKLNKQELKSRLLLAELESEYFEDLTLNKFSKSEISSLVLEDGSKVYSDLPYISIVKKYRIQILKPHKNETAAGLCDTENKIIKLFRGRYEKDKKLTLLHEMIHAYDYELVKYPTWRDFLLIYFYRKLSVRIGKNKINRIVSFESHPDCFVNTCHNLLFVLKCLEVDLRLHKKLGSVFAYGRVKRFGELND